MNSNSFEFVVCEGLQEKKPLDGDVPLDGVGIAHLYKMDLCFFTKPTQTFN